MNKLALSIWVFVLFTSCEYPAGNRDKNSHINLSAKEIETAIRKLEDVEWAEASAKKDKRWFELHLADELMMTTGRTGEVTGKQQVIAEITDTAYGGGNSDKLEELKVIPLTNSGIATFKILSNGKDKSGPYYRVARYTEIWVFRDGRWQLVASHSSLVPESTKRKNSF